MHNFWVMDADSQKQNEYIKIYIFIFNSEVKGTFLVYVESVDNWTTLMLVLLIMIFH